MENLENGVSSTPIRRRTAMPSTATVPPQQAPNGMRANSASTMPIRRRVEPTTSSVGTPIPANSRVNEGFHNPKILSIILSCLSVVGLICFFLLPIYIGETELLGDVNFKFMSFVSGQAPFKVASSLMLVGYSIVLLNSFLNFWHEKKVVFKKIFFGCNFASLVASIMTLICGFYLIFDLGFHSISLISIAILVSISILQIIAFMRCKVLVKKEKVKKEKVKKEKVKRKFKNNKALSIINLFLIALFVVFAIIQFYCKCEEHACHKCLFDITQSSLCCILLICCTLVLLYQVINNILMLKSSKIATSKYCFVSNIVCAVLSLVYVVFGYCSAEIVRPNDYLIPAIVIGVLVVITSTLQAILSREKINNTNQDRV